MESPREVDMFSELSTVSIENYNDAIIVHLEPVVNIASSFAPPNNSVGNAGRVVPKTEVSSVIRLFPPKLPIKPSEHRVTVKEQPIEIIIEQPLDENSLVNLLELLGKHTPASMSHQQKGTLFGLLKENSIVLNQLNFKKTGIRVVFRVPTQTFIPLYRLPPLFEDFIGREKELIQLQTQRNQGKNILQIAGTGGIGKSQLANYYARSQFREKNYDWIIWMSAGDLEKASDSLSTQFVELGLALGLAVNQLKDEALHLRIYERLAERGRGLVIIDNAPNYTIVKPFLPENFGRREMGVVITTRNSRTFGPSIRKIILNVFTREDAQRYIRHFLKETVTEADTEILAKTLDPFPLVLMHALTNIHEKQPPIEGAPYKLEPQPGQTKVEGIMKVIVESSLEQVKFMCKSGGAFERTMRVLLAASYLAPEVAIPKALLGKWLPEDEGEIYIDEALEALRALSLLEDDRQIATYRIHKAVQDILMHVETPESFQKKLLKWNEIIESYLDSSGSKGSEYYEERHLALEAHLAVLAQHLIVEHQVDDPQFENSRIDQSKFH
jgi:hypothetical protein